MRSIKSHWPSIATLCLTIAVGSPILAQQMTLPDKTPLASPHKQLDKAAQTFKNDDEHSIRSLTNAVFDFSRALPRSPEFIENVVKDRIIRAELAFRRGSFDGVHEQDIVHLVNWLADRLRLPAYAKTSPKQVRILRMDLILSSPAFMAAGATDRISKPGDSIPDRMSPLQAVHLISSLVDQKIINPEYQLEPAAWEKTQLQTQAAKLEEMRWLQQLQASGPPAKTHAEVRIIHRNRDLYNAMLKSGSSLSFTEAMDLCDTAFKTLRLDQ
jgi:hypothetical protein